MEIEKIMKKIFLILLSLFPLITYAQDQAVQLPEFVITGTQQVNMPVMKKMRPKLISPLSQEFFLPAYVPDNLTLGTFATPLKARLLLRKKENFYNGILDLRAGLHTMPYGSFVLDKTYGHLLVHGKLWGVDVGDYVKYSNYNESGGETLLSFYLSKKSKFLPGLKISFGARGMRNAFYLYGSKHPSFKRESRKGTVTAMMQYGTRKKFNFSGRFDASLFTLKENGLKDFNYLFKGYGEYFSSGMGVRLETVYLRDEYLTTLTSMRQSDFMDGKALLVISPFNSFRLSFGFYFAKEDTNKHFAPTLSFQFKLDNGVYMLGEYAPRSEYLPFGNMFAKNRFLSLSNLDGIFVKRGSVIRLAFRLDYGEMVEFTSGLDFRKISKLPYFEDVNNDGIFELNTLDEASSYKGFAELFFKHPRFGMLSARAEINSVRNNSEKVVPYYPLWKTDVSYVYSFPSGLKTGISLDYFSNFYADLANKKYIKNYFNLSLDLKYQLLDYLEITARAENVLNRKNFVFIGYQEKVFDLLLGVRYRF